MGTVEVCSNFLQVGCAGSLSYLSILLERIFLIKYVGGVS